MSGTPSSAASINAPHSTSHLHSHNLLILCMLIDGVGLAIIAACTMLEGMELWNDFFNEYWSSNSSSLGFWFCGRFLQTTGIFFLISHAATFQICPEIEKAGMMLLTVGPILNILSCSLFDNSSVDPFFLYNKQWLSNESLELLGISILDLSLIDTEEYLVLSAEVLGFFILACAAALDFEYSPEILLPQVTIRLDLVHLSDCFGLLLLTVVAVMQYHMKVAKHNQAHNQQSVTTHTKSTKSKEGAPDSTIAMATLTHRHHSAYDSDIKKDDKDRPQSNTTLGGGHATPTQRKQKHVDHRDE